jgi:glyoxylase-like metal-dependent hydrolase (beta-lactamase superfamily II)
MPRLPAHILVETGCRGHAAAAVIGSRSILCIDTPILPAEADTWRKKLLERGHPIAFIVQMDCSPDRAFAAAHLASIFEGQLPVLLAHQQTTDAMKTLQDSFKNNPLLGALESSSFELDPLSLRWPRPSMAFSNTMTIHWTPSEIVLYHTPGTVTGACWVHLPKEGILFLGDTVSLSLPPLLHEADIDAWLEALTALRRAPFKGCRMFCSHGGWFDAKGLAKFTGFLRAAARKSAVLCEKDDPQKDIAQASQSLADYFTFPAEREEFILRRLQISLRVLWERKHTPVPAE